MGNRLPTPRVVPAMVVRAATVALVVALGAGAAVAQPEPAPRPVVRDQRKASQAVLVDRVAAVVNSAVILQSELLTRSMPLVADLGQIADERERTRRAKKLTDQMLDDMIDEELAVQAAIEAKLEIKQKELDDAIVETRKQNNMDEASFRKALASLGYTMTSYRRDVQRQMMRMRAIQMLVRPRVTVTDEDVRARYDSMSRRSASVNKVHLHHILLALPAKPTEKQLADAKAKAATIIEKAKAGEDFKALAATYSDDKATAADGGDLGLIERGTIATEWEAVVFSMDKGEVRGPISGPQGLHVFWVSELAKSDLKPFDELKEEIRNELYRKEMDKQTSLWLNDLRRKAHIVKL